MCQFLSHWNTGTIDSDQLLVFCKKIVNHIIGTYSIMLGTQSLKCSGIFGFNMGKGQN